MARKKSGRAADRHKPRKSVAIHPLLHQQMAELAKNNDRPLYWEFRRAIQEHLRRHGVEPHQMPDDAG